MGQHDVRPDVTATRLDAARLARITFLVVLSLVISSCGIGWQDHPINTVEVRDERTLIVGYHCDVDASVQAEETAEEVRLTFRVYGGNRGDCGDVEEVELDAPLEDRTVIDASNDAEIVPCRASTSPAGQPCS